jgi:hypothetical protein
LLESCKKWQKTFFYVKNTTQVDLINLPAYVDVPPHEMKNWTYNPRSTVGAVNALHRVMGELCDAGLTPKDIIACFISRRVSPLQWRSHKICQMSGAMDPTRHSTHEPSPTDILRRVKDICKTAQTVFAWGLEPYSRDHPAPMVNHLALANISVHSLTYLLSRYIYALSDISFTPVYSLLLLWFLTNFLSPLQKFSF